MEDTTIFTTNDSYRGKGSGTRRGPKIGKPKISGRTSFTPNGIALHKLQNILFPRKQNQLHEFNDNNYAIFNAVLTDYELLRYRNMPLLAQVLIYMDMYGFENNINSSMYVTIQPYIDKLIIMDKYTPEEFGIIKIKLASEFIAYFISMKTETEKYLQNNSNIKFTPRN